MYALKYAISGQPRSQHRGNLPGVLRVALANKKNMIKFQIFQTSGQRDSNPQPFPWQGNSLAN